MSDKAKKILWTLSKVFVLLTLTYIMYSAFEKKTSGDFHQFLSDVINAFSWTIGIALLLLAVLNRFLEIKKWQNLIQTIENINVSKATKQVLSAMSFALITPNGIGEYAAKTVFFDKSLRKHIVFLNLVCNGVQLIVTVALGIIGLLYIKKYELFLMYLMAIILLLLVIVFFKRVKFKKFSFQKVVKKIKHLGNLLILKISFLAFLRFLAFSHQYIIIFYAMGVTVDYPNLIAAVCAMYLLSSSLPSFQFLEFLIRGGVGIFIFGTFGILESTVVFASIVVWLLNVVLPVLLGMLFLIKIKLPK